MEEALLPGASQRRISDQVQCNAAGVLAGMAEAVDLYHIKMHYFTSHPKLNYYAIVPVSFHALRHLTLEQVALPACIAHSRR